jgi:hypothetical protein
MPPVSWKRWGVIPCTEHLGHYMALTRLGYVPSPKLFDVKRFEHLGY